MTLTTTRRPRSLNSFLDETFNAWPFQPGDGGTVTSAWLPVTDVYEDKDAVKIVAELPGVRPQDVKLSLENSVLTIRGEKKRQPEEETGWMHRLERQYGSFERTFRLPSTVDSGRISADYEHGILTVTIPKAEKARPREIPVRPR